MSNIATLVLAAGKSSRMKTTKQLLEIESKPMLQIVLEKAINISPTSTFCTLGEKAEEIKNAIRLEKITFLNNLKHNKGLSESIKVALRFFTNNNLNFESLLVLLGDQPAIEDSYLEHLVELHKSHPNKIIASSYNNVPGVPAIFPRYFFNQLLSIDGDKGAKNMLLANKKNTILSNYTTNLIDLDTPLDYQNYVESISAKTK